MTSLRALDRWRGVCMSLCVRKNSTPQTALRLVPTRAHVDPSAPPSSSKMVRLQRLRQFWSWLPEFRVVAEVESIQEASRILGLSASSVSRTIKLLEDAMDRQLFDRRAGRLCLNDAGKELLLGTRDAMRILDDRVERMNGEVREALRLFATPSLMPILLEAVRACPTFAGALHIDEVPEGGVEAALLQGAVDLGLTRTAPRAPTLVHELAGTFTRHVYGDSASTREGFITKASDDHDDDGWPPSSARVVSLRLPTREQVIWAAQRGLGRAVLLDCEVTAFTAPLTRLPGPELEPLRIFVVQRRSVSAKDAKAERSRSLANALRALA